MTENIRAQMRKGMLEYCILLFISHGRAYPSDIVGKLEEAGLKVVEGTVYTVLNRMRREEKLSYEWEESRQGPPRKYYSLTDEGRAFLAAMSEEWSAISRAVTYFENFPQQTEN